MKCPAQEELAAIALGLAESSNLLRHLDECETCSERAASMRQLVEQLSNAHAGLDRGHDDARARLMLALPNQGEAQTTKRPKTHIMPWLGGLTMRQQAAICAMTFLVVLGFVLFWPQGVANSVEAMERMAKNIQQARSYQFVMRNTGELPGEPGKPPVQKETVIHIHWQAPGSVRMTTKPAGAAHETVRIMPHNAAGIEIDDAAKTYRRMPAQRGHVSPLTMVDRLSKYSGDADRDLGTRKIEGRKARGFEIDSKRIDPDAFAGRTEVWLDVQTNLPLQVRYEVELVGMPKPMVMQMEQFQWNTDMDPELFDTKPPAGYADATPKPPTTDERVKHITTALRSYAEICGGRYPQVKMVYGDVTRDDMLRQAGIVGRPTSEQIRSNKYAKIVRATHGFAHLNGILRDEPTAAYHGRTVTPADTAKVLLRWRTAEDKYQVIYGNLKTDVVSTKRLQELEK